MQVALQITIGKSGFRKPARACTWCFLFLAFLSVSASLPTYFLASEHLSSEFSVSHRPLVRVCVCVQLLLCTYTIDKQELWIKPATKALPSIRCTSSTVTWIVHLFLWPLLLLLLLLLLSRKENHSKESKFFKCLSKVETLSTPPQPENKQTNKTKQTL